MNELSGHELISLEDYIQKHKILPIRHQVSLIENKEDGCKNCEEGKLNIRNPQWLSKYTELKPELKTGDIILVEGRYPWSWLIKLLQGSEWGHSAMVIHARDLDPGNALGLPELMLWESNVDDLDIPNLWGNDRGKVKGGPMLVSLEERLKHTYCNFEAVKIVHRPLNFVSGSPGFDKLPGIFDSVIDKGFPSDLEMMRSAYIGRKYNKTLQDNDNFQLQLQVDEALSSVYEMSANNEWIESLTTENPKKENIYCTELLALTFMNLELLTSNYVSNAYIPKDFSDEGNIRFFKGGRLGPQMFINMCK